jgi:chorismate mutase
MLSNQTSRLIIDEIYKSIMQNISTRSHSNFVAKAKRYSGNKEVTSKAKKRHNQ